MKNTASVQINLNAIRHNLNLVKQLAPKSKILAMVKANAYGHGLLPVAKSLAAADGLAVARLQEALTLREHGIQQRIVVLGSLLSSDELALCSQHRLDVIIHSQQGADTLLKSTLPQPINIWLKIDTGMHRLGLMPEQYASVFSALEQAPQVSELINMTHLCCADELADAASTEQLRCFDELTQHNSAPKSAANSAALIRYQHAHYDWVRPGIMLYGADPLHEGSCLSLLPAMSLSSRVLAIRQLQAQETVGYGRSWQATRPTQLATVGIGYGDGYPRHASNNTPVLVANQPAVIVGRVSMDLITVDISDCSGIKVGDEVVLWNAQLKANEIARCADTISYELFTSITSRVERKYS